MSNPPEQPAPLAELTLFYCGHGDTLLIGSAGHWGLIDCHLTKTSGAYQQVRQRITDWGIKRLDFVCLTHPDRDHYYGMKELLEERFFDKDSEKPAFVEFWDGGIPYPLLMAIEEKLTQGKCIVTQGLKGLYEGLIDPLMDNDRIVGRALQGGFTPPIDFGDFLLTALAPQWNQVQRFSAQSAEKISGALRKECEALRETSNDLSIVLVLRHKHLPVQVILGGDATTRAWPGAIHCWNRILETEGKNRDARFAGVKVSHHGAKTSHHGPLYEGYCQGGDTVAFVSVGPDDENHPHPDVLQHIESLGIRVYATCWPRGAEPRAAMPESLFFFGEPEPTEHVRPHHVEGFGWSDLTVHILPEDKVKVFPEEARLVLN